MPIDITSKATWSLYPIRETTVVSAKTRPCREGSHRKRRNATEKVNETCAGAGSKVKSPRSWHMSSVQCNSKKRRDDQQHTITNTDVKSTLTAVSGVTRRLAHYSHANSDGKHKIKHTAIAAGSREKADAWVRERSTHFSKNTITSCTRSVATTETDGRFEATRWLARGPMRMRDPRNFEFILIISSFPRIPIISHRDRLRDITASKQLVAYKVSTMNICNNK